MTKYCLRKSLGVFALFAVSAGATFAQSAYVGIGAGLSQWNIEWENSTIADTTDPGFKSYMGYNFTDMWGAEVFFIDLGKTLGGGASQIDAAGYGIAGVLNLRFGQNSPWRLFARAGAARMEGKGTATNGADGTQKSVQAALGAGVGFAVTKKLILRADFDAMGVELTDGQTINVGQISGGLSILF